MKTTLAEYGRLDITVSRESILDVIKSARKLGEASAYAHALAVLVAAAETGQDIDTVIATLSKAAGRK